MTQTRKGKQEQTSQTKQALHVLFDTQTQPKPYKQRIQNPQMGTLKEDKHKQKN